MGCCAAEAVLATKRTHQHRARRVAGRSEAHASSCATRFAACTLRRCWPFHCERTASCCTFARWRAGINIWQTRKKLRPTARAFAKKRILISGAWQQKVYSLPIQVQGNRKLKE